MRLVFTLLAGLAIGSAANAFSAESAPQKSGCECVNCACTADSHCGCYSEKGCHCTAGQPCHCTESCSNTKPAQS